MGIRRETEKRRKKEGRWRGWKSKVSVFLIMSLLLTGTKGVSVQGEGEERKNYAENALEVEGNRVRLHFTVESLRELSEKAIQEGKPLSITEGELSYSNDPELLSRYRAIFSKDKEIYEIPLSDEVEGLDALPLENGGRIRAFVEAEPKAQTESTEKSEEESVLLFSENSEFGKLMAEERPDWYRENLKYIEENKKDEGEVEAKKTGEDREKTVKQEIGEDKEKKVIEKDREKQEIKEKNESTESKENGTESTGKEENGATCPPVLSPSEINTVEPLPASGSVLPSKEESAKGHTEKAESSAEKQEKQSENSENQLENSRKDYHVSGIETIYFLYENAGEEKLSFRLFVGENSYPTVRIQGRDKEAEKALLGGKEYFSDIRLLKFQKYSLNELGRYSQNKEVEGFGTVEAFYDKEAFSEKVSLNVTLLKKPEDISEEEKGEESGEGEKSKEKASSSDILKENEVEALKNRGLYDQSLSLDIRFLNKEGKEVEPSLPVSLRFYIEKKLLPEKVESENIAIHHLVEKEEDGEIAYVETLSEAKESAGGKGKAIVGVSGGTENVIEKEEFEEDKGGVEEKKNKDDDEDEIKNRLEEKETESIGIENNKKYKEGEVREESNNEDCIIKECNTKSFSIYTVSWSDEHVQTGNVYYFCYVDGDFRKMGPDIYIDMRKFEDEMFFYQHKSYPGGGGYEVSYIFQDLPGYTRHELVIPTNIEFAKLNEKIARETAERTGSPMVNVWAVRDGYGFDWGYPVRYMTSRRVITQHNLDSGLAYYDNSLLWETAHNICKQNYYFFYKLNKMNYNHSYTKHDMEMKQEKYITKKSDGSYDITLTARPNISESEKNKLDVIIVYDKSMYMGFPYDDEIPKYGRPKYDKINGSLATSRHAYGKQMVKNLVDDLSKNPAYDAQFALVTMGGTRKFDYQLENKQFKGVKNFTDTAYNDAKKEIGFTGNVVAFKQAVDGIQLDPNDKNGLNYTAGIREAKAFQNGDTAGLGCQPTRSDARRVVLFVTSYDPNFSYFPKYNADGAHPFYPFEEVERSGHKVPGKIAGKTMDSLWIGGVPSLPSFGEYKFSAKYEAGYSYGSGRGYEEAALTQARGALTELNKIDAFYAVGLGPGKNYSHLDDLLGGKVFWAAKSTPEQPLDPKIEQQIIKVTNKDDISKNIRIKLRTLVSPIRIGEVNIWDQLSENVKVNFNNSIPADKDAKLRAEVWKVDDNGKAISKVDNPEDSEDFFGFKGVEASYDPVKEIIELKTKPGEISFPKGYEIRLTVNVKPTIKAYEKYQKNFMDYFDKDTERLIKAGNNDIGYLDNVNGENISGTRAPTAGTSLKLGDQRTDQWFLYQEVPEEDFHTSSGKEGFYSNEGAYLRYVRFKEKNQREEPPKKKYQKPVIQIEPATLRIVKSFQGTASSKEELELLKNCSFKLEEEKTAGTGVFTEVKSFKMMKSSTGTELGYLVSAELNGTAISGTGKNPTKTTPAGTLTEVMNGGEKQYVLTIKGLIPGRKYRVSEMIPSEKETSTIAGRTLHFKKIEITATSSRTINTGSSGAYVLETLNLSEAETKELKLKNIYETEEKQILRIQKKVSGTWGDRNLLFPFRLKLFKAGGVAINQTDFDSLKANFSAATKSAISFYATDSTIRFSLKDGQGLDFLLPAGYQYQVGEDPKGYLPSVTSGYTLGMTPIDGYRFTAKKVLQKKTGGAKEVLEFENRKDPIPPMGALASSLILPGNFLLFLLMLIFLLQVKMKRKERK